MSQQTTTKPGADGKSYQAHLIALLGERDPLKVMGQTADTLAGLVGREPPEVMRARPFKDRWTWTPNEIIGHLTDAEWVYGFRIRLILCEERPRILGMDQELWVKGQRYNERATSELLDSFEALRVVNLALWARITPEQHARVGLHNERGEESLGLMFRMHAGHDLSHIDQITRYLAATKAGGR